MSETDVFDSRAPYSAAEVDAALEALSQPGRLAQAQALVARAAPALEGVLAQALEAGGWFSEAHEQAVARAVQPADERERSDAVSTLVAEETRLGMLVGVTVGLELAQQLERSHRSRLDGDGHPQASSPSSEASTESD